MAKADPSDSTDDPQVASSTGSGALRGTRVAGAKEDTDPTENADSAIEAQQLENLQSQLADADVQIDTPGEGEDPTGGSLSSPLDGLEDRFGRGDPMIGGLDDQAGSSDNGAHMKYGKEGIAQGQDPGSGYTFGSNEDGADGSFFTGLGAAYAERREYTTYEREMTMKADEIAGTRSGGSGSGGDSGSGSPGGTDTSSNPVLHEYDGEDGSHTTVYESGDIVTTYDDGTVVHSYENEDGSQTTVTEKPDGTTTTTTTNADGSTTTTTTTKNPDGSTTTETTTTPPPSPHAGEEEGEAEEEQGDGEGEATQGDDKPSTESSVDPDDPDANPLPPDIQAQLDADLAAMRAHQTAGGGGDGATDPVEDDSSAFGSGALSGVAVDPQLRYLGDPPDPEDAHYGGHPLGEAPPGSGDIDPAPGEDTAVHTTGPEERATTHDLETTADEPSADEGTDTGVDPLSNVDAPPDLPSPALLSDDVDA